MAFSWNLMVIYLSCLLQLALHNSLFSFHYSLLTLKSSQGLGDWPLTAKQLIFQEAFNLPWTCRSFKNRMPVFFYDSSYNMLGSCCNIHHFPHFFHLLVGLLLCCLFFCNCSFKIKKSNFGSIPNCQRTDRSRDFYRPETQWQAVTRDKSELFLAVNTLQRHLRAGSSWVSLLLKGFWNWKLNREKNRQAVSS